MIKTLESPKNLRIFLGYLGLFCLSCSKDENTSAQPPPPTCVANPSNRTGANEASSTLSIINGTPANNSDALEKGTAGIFALYKKIGTEDYYASYCTGVLVGKDALLTAAHCLLVEPGMQLATLRAYFGANMQFISANNSYVIEKAIAHPKFSEDLDSHTQINQNYDIAVVKLARPAPSTQMIPSFLDDPSKLTATSDIEITAIGYGKTSSTLDAAGEKRRTNTFIHSLINPRIPGFTFDTYPASSLFNQVRVVDKNNPPRGACEGDSGGPAFLKDQPIVFGLVQGVNSSVNDVELVSGTDQVSCEKGDLNYTLIAPYTEWIKGQLGFPLNTSGKALTYSESFSWGGIRSKPVAPPQSTSPTIAAQPPEEVKTQVENTGSASPQKSPSRTLIKVCE